MPLPVEASSITHGIQLAVAPVFLLTAVASMIGAVAGRLARIIDRARLVEGRVEASADPGFVERGRFELQQLRMRGMLANGCIALLTLCGFLIGLTIVVLFLGETSGFRISGWAVASFLAGVCCFLAALLVFLVETYLATRLLDFRLRHPRPGPSA